MARYRDGFTFTFTFTYPPKYCIEETKSAFYEDIRIALLSWSTCFCGPLQAYPYTFILSAVFVPQTVLYAWQCLPLTIREVRIKEAGTLTKPNFHSISATHPFLTFPIYTATVPLFFHYPHQGSGLLVSPLDRDYKITVFLSARFYG
jgi:hypothetical protein